MRLPYLRKAAPDVLATARAQRWEPAEVLRVLLTEEVAARDAATRRMRRKTAAFPSGKTFSLLAGRGILHPRRHPGRPGHPGMDRTGGEPGHRRPVRDRQVASSRGPGPRRDRERPARRLVHPGDPHHRDRESESRRVGRPHRHQDTAAATSSWSMTSACSGRAGTPPRRSTASPTPPTSAAPSRSTSNIHPSGFDTIMPKTLATATVDRLLHHAHLVLAKGDSHRLAEALAGKGVIPLATQPPPAGRTRGHAAWKTGSTLKWPHCSSLIWPHPGVRAAGW